MKIEYSEVKLDENLYLPYIEIKFTDRLVLDPEMFYVKRNSETIENVLIDSYRQALEGLQIELKKHGF